MQIRDLKIANVAFLFDFIVVFLTFLILKLKTFFVFYLLFSVRFLFYFYFFSNLFPSFFFRHPHGPCATFLLSHCKEAIIFSFVLSPILCFPTLFVFKVRERRVEDSDVPLYHVDADKSTALYR